MLFMLRSEHALSPRQAIITNTMEIFFFIRFGSSCDPYYPLHTGVASSLFLHKDVCCAAASAELTSASLAFNSSICLSFTESCSFLRPNSFCNTACSDTPHSTAISAIVPAIYHHHASKSVPFSKQIAMRTCPNQFQNQSLSINLVNEQPIRLNVTLPHVLIVSGICEGVILI